MSEADGQTDDKAPVAFAIETGDVLDFLRQLHELAAVRGCRRAYVEALACVGEKIKGLEAELAARSGRDPYVMGEISALAQFAADLKAGAGAAELDAGGRLEMLTDWCRDNGLAPLLFLFVQSIRKQSEAGA
jgi:hypothetical protein